jgi:cell wall-associated NlpC family hydrolase
MGEGSTTRVGAIAARGPRRAGGRPDQVSRAWWRTAASVATAFVMAVPLFGLAQTISPLPAVAAPDEPCVAVNSVLPATKSAREATAAKAAARWFPADQVAMATAVAGAESSWNPTAVNKAARGNYGLWQINSVHDNLLDAKSWKTPADNAWMAFQVWDAADGTKGDGRGSWKPWSVFNSGSYKAYLRESVPVTDQTSVCVEAPPGAEIRVSTWNVLLSNSRKGIAGGVRELTSSSDVFGLQEMGSSADRATALRAASAAGFTMTTDRTAVPIFYRTEKYTAIEQGRQRAFSAGQRVEKRGGKGTEKTKDKWVTWVQLQDNATQETFYVVNTHLLVGAYNKGVNGKNKKRIALYNRQLDTVRALTDQFQSSGSSVYVTCDCNVNYDADADPVGKMGDSGLIANWRDLDGSPTLGKKQRLDYVWSNRTPSSQDIGEKSGSDHAMVTVTYPPTTGPSGTMTPVNGSTAQEIYSMRTVTDPTSSRTFLVPIPTGRAGKVLNRALDQVGDRWAFGGDGPDAWDCSGLTADAWDAADIALPHQSEAQQQAVKNVDLADAQPGDIFWREGYTAIYLGTVGNERLVVGARKSESAVVIHVVDSHDIKAVLHPTS